jgi:hypothetical protein
VGELLFAVLMAVSSRYGFQRDELYFLDCARHLSASYVDQPGFGPLLARVSLLLFGVSLTGLRVWPALAAWAITVIGGLTAREFGGGRRTQLLAAIGVATMPAVTAGPATHGHRSPARDGLDAGRDGRLAATGRHGPYGVAVDATRSAARRGDLHRRLQRGRSHQRTGPG